METEFIPLDYDYLDIDTEEGKKNIVRIFGRTKQGKTICVLDSCEPYFWIIPEKTNLKKLAEKIEKIKFEHAGRQVCIKKIEIKDKNYMNKQVKALQVFVSNHKDLFEIGEKIKKISGIKDKREIDINFTTRYIIDKEVLPLNWYKVSGKSLNLDPEYKNAEPEEADICILAEKIEKTKQYKFLPRVMAFDIEASEFEIGKGEILMISLSGGNFKKVFTWKKLNKKPKFVEYVKDEAELIEKFKETIKKENPDFLVGYFSDGFDMPYLRARADKYNIKLDLGKDKSNVTFIRGGFVSSSHITGLVHIDLYRFVNNILAPNLQSETISLNQVSKELVGEEKLKINLDNLNGNLNGIDLERFYKYNLQDSVLTEKLFYKLWPNIEEVSRLVQEPPFIVSRNTYSQLVESYILVNLKRFNEIALSRPTREKIEDRRKRGKYKGAYVKEPSPGLYNKVAMLDFTSLYPSIIASFNISPATIKKSKENCYITPEFDFNGKKQQFCFDKKPSFIPLLIKEIMEKRKKIKTELKTKYLPELDARSYALKTIMNATYGYFAFFGARYYSVECAAAIAAFARYYLQEVIKEAEKQFQVIYGDTDSIALSLKNKTENSILQFLEKINKKLPGVMELDLEDFYTRGIFVLKRTGEAGAKKKYALINKKGKIKIRGFETVRRDWCNLAKELQNSVIEMILEEGNADAAIKYIKQIIKKLKEKKIDKRELIIFTQLKKPLSEYKAITPHVVIARKMHEQELPIGIGTMISYYIAESKNKKALVRERAKLPEEKGDYDTEYYINHQILPAVENILDIFNISMQELKEGKKQTKLDGF